MGRALLRRCSLPASAALIALVATLGAACAGGSGGAATTTASTAAAPTAPAPPTGPVTSDDAAPATTAPSRPLEGAHVHVVGLWSGPELDAFREVAATWEAATGATLDWEGSDDLAGRLAGGDPPDVAVLPNLALMRELAAAGALVPLDEALDMARLRADYAPTWLDLGSRDGHLYGVFAKVTDKSTVWYSPERFAARGYEVPRTWAGLLALADGIVAEGGTPFSIVAPSGPGRGWALTDWVSQLVLGGCGPRLYDRWVAGEVPWTHPCVAAAFGRFARLVGTPGYVRGGVAGILGTGDDEGAYAPFEEPPSAALYYLASFAQGFIAARFPELEPGRDYGVFPLPAADRRYRDAITVGGDVPVLVTDTPAARSLLAFLASAPAQEAWIRRGGFTSANRSVSPDAYADPVSRAIAAHLAGAGVARYAAGDLLPSALQRTWWDAMVDLVQEPDRLPAILVALDEAARTAAADHGGG